MDTKSDLNVYNDPGLASCCEPETEATNTAGPVDFSSNPHPSNMLEEMQGEDLNEWAGKFWTHSCYSSTFFLISVWSNAARDRVVQDIRHKAHLGFIRLIEYVKWMARSAPHYHAKIFTETIPS